MIQVQSLSKRYGEIAAVDRLSFDVGKREIVGFLGPNGAGKTTTMRMLTTYLMPTSGVARLAGHDILDAPLEVRKHTGYLPENVPLYPEMRVREYLNFRARLKDVNRWKRRSAVDRVVGRCRLEDVDDRPIGQLSKGYRQRVGLADAMVHDPEILILDEPTAGLDPIQIREVRALIRDLGEQHTILLSTHILPEVEAVCSRVLLIARGKLSLDERLEKLRDGCGIVVEVRGPVDAVRRVIEATPGVHKVAVAGRQGEVGSFEVHPGRNADPREAIAARMVQNGWGLARLDLRRSTLEERFIEAVSRAEPEKGDDKPESEAA